MLYHVSQKAVPKNFNPFVAVLSAYLVGVVLCLIALRLDTSVALALIPIGWLLFKEQLSLRGVIGVACCLLGLYLLAKR